MGDIRNCSHLSSPCYVRLMYVDLELMQIVNSDFTDVAQTFGGINCTANR